MPDRKIVHVSMKCLSTPPICIVDIEEKLLNNGNNSQIDLYSGSRSEGDKKILTFFGWHSSSVGYHFCAFWAGMVLSPFPNFFVWPTDFESKVADILDNVTKIWKRRKLRVGGDPSCRWSLSVGVVVYVKARCFCGIPCPTH